MAVAGADARDRQVRCWFHRPAAGSALVRCRYRDSMKAWDVHRVERPSKSETRSWWIDATGSVYDQPIADATRFRAVSLC